MNSITMKNYSRALHSSNGMPVFLLDNLRSAFNVGSVFRATEAISPAAVFLCGICARPGGRKLGRTSRGTNALVPWKYFRDSTEAAEWGRNTGRLLVAVENLEDSVPLWDADFPLSSVFMFGNEARGLDPALSQMADIRVMFPQSGRRTCINVSGMAAVIAAELQRRRYAGCRVT